MLLVSLVVVFIKGHVVHIEYICDLYNNVTCKYTVFRHECFEVLAEYLECFEFDLCSVLNVR